LRFIRKKGTVRKKPSYYPYRSALERRVAGKLKGYDYEPKTHVVEYSMPHKYTPDFVPNACPHVMLEVKGYFRTSSEASKYVAIKRGNPEREIIFIFSNPMKKAHPSCKVRTDGTILTLAEWCRNHKFLYYNEKELPSEIIHGTICTKWIKKERKEMGYDSK